MRSQSFDRLSASISAEERNRLQMIRKYREERLIVLIVFSILTPLFVLTIISFFVPYLYTIIPVYETDICWSYFEEKNGIIGICPLKIVNHASFIIFNWLQLVGFIFIYWKIRNIRNELNIKMEIVVIMTAWGFFSMIYFILNFVRLQGNQPQLLYAAQVTIFIIILLRNLFTLCATTMFSIYMLIKHPENAYPVLYEGKLLALDFNMVLNSCEPFEAFAQFISKHSPNNYVFIEVFVRIRLYEEGINELNDAIASQSFSKKVNELLQNKKDILEIIQDNYITHFAAGHNSVQNDDIINNQNMERDAIQEELSQQLKTFIMEGNKTRDLNMYEWTDFSHFQDMAKRQLQKIYENEFKHHERFNELITKLYKNEIEYKFLEHAKVIKGGLGNG